MGTHQRMLFSGWMMSSPCKWTVEPWQSAYTSQVMLMNSEVHVYLFWATVESFSHYVIIWAPSKMLGYKYCNLSVIKMSHKKCSIPTECAVICYCSLWRSVRDLSASALLIVRCFLLQGQRGETTKIARRFAYWQTNTKLEWELCCLSADGNSIKDAGKHQRVDSSALI